MPVDSEITITPTASELVEISAIAASPLIWLFPLIRRSRTAARITTGIATASGAAFSAAATARAPKPTWESPSPIIEYLFRTRLTPSRAEQRATRAPTINARTMKG